MQRMRHAALDRAQGGVQRLPEHLSAEHPPGAEVAALAAEQVLLKLLQFQLVDQVPQSVRDRQWALLVHSVKRTSIVKKSMP